MTSPLILARRRDTDSGEFQRNDQMLKLTTFPLRIEKMKQLKNQNRLNIRNIE